MINSTTESRERFHSCLLFLVSCFLFFLTPDFAAAQDGAKLFKANCAACHRVDDKKLTGPGLKDVFLRVPSEEWLYPWIKNSQKVIASGDAYANKIFEEYGKAIMTPQEHLSDADIKAILEYIKNPPAPTVSAPVAEIPGEKKPADDKTTLYFLLVIALLLIITIAVLSGVKRTLQNLVNAKKGLPPVPEMGYWETATNWISTHKTHTAVIILLLLLYGSTKAWYAMQKIGIYQGYAPEQPIKFSHKVHAGTNQINCLYCHHSAEKGKTAGIPSVNVCMNCHRGISEGTKTGTSEIAKIYDAAGWNTETQKYDKPQKPIKWIRVHNLPDFAYFNHSQHVVVGKQQCQTCHGKVEEMDVLEQHSSLTMGWCVDCHRNTSVAMEGNGYYEKIHSQITSKYKDNKGNKDRFTVANMGGLECGKCHY